MSRPPKTNLTVPPADKPIDRTCPYCGGPVNRRGWIIGSERLNSRGETEEYDQAVHQKCQRQQNQE